MKVNIDIPKNWELKYLGDLGKVINGLTYSPDDIHEDGVLVLRSSNVLNRSLAFEDNVFVNVGEGEYNPVLENDILICVRNGSRNLIGKNTLITKEAEYMAFGAFMTVFRSPYNKFLFQVFDTDVYNNQVYRNLGATINSINGSDLKKFKVPFPPLSEQRKIAEILSTWDEAIAQTKALIELLKLRNKGLAQQLLTGKKRLKGFGGEWKEVRLEKYFSERNERGYDDLNLLSVGELGVYPHSESNKKDTSNADKAKYKRICPGDIGYNTMRMWQGRSALSSFEGIVSPAYTIVTPKENADPRFFAHLFKQEPVIHKFFRNSQGLVSDTLNCKFKDFKNVKVFVPMDKSEQSQIAKIITKGAEEIKGLEQKMLLFKEQKKGLMQKLLTGEVRVSLMNND